LLVIDMQNSFCHPDGALYQPLGAPLAGIEDVVPSCRAAVQAARRSDLPVIFTRHGFAPDYSDAGPVFTQYADHLAERGGLLRGSWDSDIIDDLEREPADTVIDKNRMDSFHGTDLDDVLQSQGISSLVLVGVVTNACVESTTRSAAMRDYPVELLADCCAGVTRQHHEMSLECLHAYQFANVTTLSDALSGSLAGLPVG
jgi:ureidoacrylate peracid hydrolase